MLTKEKLLDLTGLKKIGTDYSLRGVGLIFGYPVEAVAVNNGTTLILAFTTADSFGKKPYKQLRNALWENPTLKDRVEMGNLKDDGVFNTFRINIDFLKEQDPQELYDLTIQSLEKALEGLPELAPTATCVECKAVGGDMLAYYDGALHFFHRTCLQKLKDEMEQSFEEKEANPKLLGGLIGGFFGGIVGALPELAALVFFNYSVWLLYALIPLGIFYGWKLAGGKIVKFTTVFTIVYTLIVSVAIWLLFIALGHRSYWAEWGINITVGEAFADVFFFINYYTDEFMDMFLLDSILALGAAVFGILIAWRQITKTDAQAFHEAQANYDEAVSLREL